MLYRTVGWACLALLLPGEALAQTGALVDGAALAPAAVDAPPRNEALPTVVVTATAPTQAAQTVLKPKGQTGAQDDMAPLLRQVSGIQVNRQSGTAGTVLLRGLGGARLPVVQDGIAMEGACNHGMDPATSYIDPEAVDQVTVVKGPSTVRHAGVLAGALLFERRAPSASAPSELQLSQTLAAFDKQQTHAEGLLNTEATWARLKARHAQSGDERDGHGQRIPSRYQRDNLDLDLGWRLDGQQTLSADIARSDGWAVYPSYHMDGTRFLSNSLGLRWQAKRLSPLIRQAQAQARWQSVDHAMDNFSLRGEAGTYQPDADNRLREIMQQQNRSRAASARVELDVAPDHVLTLGLDTRLDSYSARNHLTSTQCFDFGVGPTCFSNDPGVTPYYDLRVQQSGGYAEWRTSQDATLWTAGLRVDSRSTRAGDVRAFTVNATPVHGQNARRDMLLHSGFIRAEHTLNDDWQAHLAWGQAERGPDFVEIGSLQAYDLPVERHREWSTGLRYAAQRLSASVNGFINLIDNFMLVTSGTSAKSVQALRRGLEADFSWAVASGLEVGGALSTVWASNRSDHVPLAQTPPTQLRLYMAWQQARWGVKLSTRMADGQARIDLNHGSTNGLDVATTPGFSVWDMEADYQASKQWRVSVGLDNLFDRYYVEHLNHSSSPSWVNLGARLPDQIPEAGRRWWLKLGMNLP